MTVTKKEIIEIVAERTKQRKNHTKVIIECVFDVFIETLARERRIEVRNFGVFRVKKTPARIGRNPVTKESADVPARNIVQFKAGKYMKDVVAGLDPVREPEDNDSDYEDSSVGVSQASADRPGFSTSQSGNPSGASPMDSSGSYEMGQRGFPGGRDE